MLNANALKLKLISSIFLPNNNSLQSSSFTCVSHQGRAGHPVNWKLPENDFHVFLFCFFTPLSTCDVLFTK